MKTVTVYSTTGKNAFEVKTQAGTWGVLKNDLSREGVSFSSMKCVIGESKLTLESSSAVLPESDFTLFLMPIKTKSGASDRKSIMESIKAIVNSNPAAKSHFMQGRLNMTQLPTATLETMLATYNGTAVPVQEVKATPEKKEVKAEPKKESKPEPKMDVSDVLEQKKERILEVLECTDIDEEDEAEVKIILEEMISLVTFIGKAFPAPKAAYVPSPEEIKRQKLDAQARELASQFSDVKSF